MAKSKDQRLAAWKDTDLDGVDHFWLILVILNIRWKMMENDGKMMEVYFQTSSDVNMANLPQSQPFLFR